MKNRFMHSMGLSLAGLVCLMISSGSLAAQVEVKMLNKGADGGMMEFEPAFVRIAVGDSVHFVAVDKGHDVAAITKMIPEGVAPFKGEMDKDLVVKFTKSGVYGYRCNPHFIMGMVGLVQVGEPVNEEAAKQAISSGMSSTAKNKFRAIFELVDAKN
jgi:pseudoazurin